ncbi:MAG: glutamine amidotransferase [Pseudoalteromonas tetraodonis]|jgi:glutamine amidotransferase
MMIGVVDYGAGNQRSIRNALDALEAKHKTVASPDDLEDIDKLIFPGVGAFGDSMANLNARGLVAPIRDWISADRPFFGICIGFQLLFEGSEESPGAAGIGAFEGQVIRFPEKHSEKVPHMGWNGLSLTDPQNPAWDGLDEEPHMYFVHSYFPSPADQSLIASTTNYGIDFASSIQVGNVTATQFHPEKSQTAGLRLINNFIRQHRL